MVEIAAAGFLIFFIAALITVFFIWGIQRIFLIKDWISVSEYENRAEFFRIIIMLISAALLFISILTLLMDFFDIPWDWE
jgi:hypothetical protein